MADSLALPDGRIVVFRWGENSESAGPQWPEVVIYDSAADTWDPVTFAGDRPSIGSDHAFTLAADGRIYTYDSVIDPTREDWSVTPLQWIQETDLWGGMAAGSNGRIYMRADTGQTMQLTIYDTETDTLTRSSLATGERATVFNFRIVSGGDVLHLIGYDGDGVGWIITYDPASDTWSTTQPVGSDQLLDFYAVVGAAVGPDGLIYVPRVITDTPAQFWAISPDDGSWDLVEPPQDFGEPLVKLLWGPDDRLYAFGREQVWAFTPSD